MHARNGLEGIGLPRRSRHVSMRKSCLLRVGLVEAASFVCRGSNSGLEQHVYWLTSFWSYERQLAHAKRVLCDHLRVSYREFWMTLLLLLFYLLRVLCDHPSFKILSIEDVKLDLEMDLKK